MAGTREGRMGLAVKPESLTGALKMPEAEATLTRRPFPVSRISFSYPAPTTGVLRR
jgi:hypothetical protein